MLVGRGVIFYLTAPAAHSTLKYTANQAQPTQAVLDYLQATNTNWGRAHLQARSDRLGAAGERFFTYFTLDEIAQHQAWLQPYPRTCSPGHPQRLPQRID